MSSCALGLDPAKSSSGTSVSLHLSSLASVLSGRAIIQGTGCLYIQTGSTAADAKLYGPWQTGSGELFSTSEVPSGSYDSFSIIYLDSPALASPVFVDEDHTSIMSALQSRLSDLPEALSSCSCAVLSGVSVRANRDNPIEATLVPVTTTEIDISLPAYLSVPEASSGTARVFIKLYGIAAMNSSCQLVDSLTFALSGTGTVSRMALYSLSGKLISAAANDNSGSMTLSYPSSGASSCFLYIEYSGKIDQSMVGTNYSNPSRGVWYVSQTGGSDGSDAAHPCWLEAAIQCINISSFSGTQTIFLTENIPMSSIGSSRFLKNAVITSAGATPYAISYVGAPDETNSKPFFYIGNSTISANVTISNCTIEVGQPISYFGHLIEVTNGNLVLSAGATLRNNPSTTNGGAVLIDATGKLTMAGGTIENCSSTLSGGAVYITGGGSFTMSAGTISSCSASSSGGAVYITGGSSSFSMTGGRITNSNALNGGAVGISGGTFTMSDGNIDSCVTSGTSGVGGGVYISSSGTMNMNGGTIATCIAKAYLTTSGKGGAIYLDGSTLNMSSGLISNCSAGGSVGRGGGLYVSLGTVSFSGGSISGCGGTDGGAMFLNGGSTEFTAISNIAQLTLSGNVAPASNNIYKTASATITVNGTLTTSALNLRSLTGYSDSSLDITWL